MSTEYFQERPQTRIVLEIIAESSSFLLDSPNTLCYGSGGNSSGFPDEERPCRATGVGMFVKPLGIRWL